jgi:hypothetical protein
VEGRPAPDGYEDFAVEIDGTVAFEADMVMRLTPSLAVAEYAGFLTCGFAGRDSTSGVSPLKKPLYRSENPLRSGAPDQ